MSSWNIEAVNCGKTQAFRGEDHSAIVKRVQDGPVAVGPMGLSGDEQADRVHHGGVDMAVHQYPHDHYAHWRGMLGDHALLASSGAFGENISTEGLLESEAAIGDRYRLGSAVVEISQGRKPCWKIAHRFNVPKLTAEVVTTGRSGWYYRVLQPGHVAAGDRLELLERPHPAWTVERVLGLIVSGSQPREAGVLRELASLTALSADWRRRAADLIAA